MQAAGLNESLTGKVVSVGAKGVVVDVGVRGFVPTSHLDLDPVSDLSPFLNQVIELKVLEADPQRERLVLSRRSLLLRDQRKKAQELLSSLAPGDVRRGKVTSITNYGAFVDIGGVNGLVHLSELSWRRIRRPNDVVSLGDEVRIDELDGQVEILIIPGQPRLAPFLQHLALIFAGLLDAKGINRGILPGRIIDNPVDLDRL